MSRNNHPTETEIKIRIPEESLGSLRKKLLYNGFRSKDPRALETNTLFDYQDQRIYRAGSALRLRSYGKRNILTWKGPLQPDRELKIREEIETEVSSPGAALLILARIGLQPALEYSKFRETFAPEAGGRVEVCLDETRAGCYIEIEGSGGEISRVMELLGLESSSQVRESYIELLGLAGPRNGEKE